MPPAWIWRMLPLIGGCLYSLVLARGLFLKRCPSLLSSFAFRRYMGQYFAEAKSTITIMRMMTKAIFDMKLVWPSALPPAPSLQLKCHTLRAQIFNFIISVMREKIYFSMSHYTYHRVIWLKCHIWRHRRSCLINIDLLPAAPGFLLIVLMSIFAQANIEVQIN